MRLGSLIGEVDSSQGTGRRRRVVAWPAERAAGVGGPLAQFLQIARASPVHPLRLSPSVLGRSTGHGEAGTLATRLARHAEADKGEVCRRRLCC